MIIEGLIEDVSNICLSYLSYNEQIYIKGNWNEFNKDYVCETAAEKGWLDLLIWAREPERNYHWNGWTCAYAALNGHLSTLKWARENGCELGVWACYFAAKNNQLEILKWLENNGCNWDEYVCKYAAMNDHLDILKWMKDNGCKCGGAYHKNKYSFIRKI